MLTIAICDDDIQFCKTLRQMIQHELQARNTDAETEVFLTGEEMCKAFAKKHFDLIFLDIELTGINGVSVGQILRQTAQDMQLVLKDMQCPKKARKRKKPKKAVKT